MTITRITETHAEVSDREITTIGTAPTRSLTNPLTGAYSWRFTLSTDYFILPLYDATAMRASLHMYMDDFPAGDINIFSIKESLTALLAVEARIMEDENTIRLYVDGVQQDEETWVNAGFTTTEWMQLSIVASSTQNFASVYLNDTKILTYSGAIARAPWDLCNFAENIEASGFSQYTYIDDVYIDSMTTEGDAHPPAYRFLPSYAKISSAVWAWTPIASTNDTQVDDGAVDDGDATYNFVTTSGGTPQDQFLHTGVTLPLNYSISAAIPFVVVRKLNAGDDAQIENMIEHGPFAYSSPHTVPITYGVRRDRMVLQPDGSTWNEADFNAAELGYRVAGSF